MRHLRVSSTPSRTIEQMFLGSGKFFEGDKTTEKRDMTQVVALEIDFKSPFLELNHF